MKKPKQPEHSVMETFYDNSLWESDTRTCSVKIAGDEIRVEYEWGGHCVYSGKTIGNKCHFHLQWTTPENSSGTAYLHRFRDTDTVLEGYWEESGHRKTWRGMWRVKLNKKPLCRGK